MANVRVVASLEEVNTALQDLNINDVGQVNEVQFQLHEQASLQDAAMMKMKTRPRRQGFRLLNPELLECKYEAKMMLETSMNRVLDASIHRIDEDLERIVNSIATLKVLVNTPDHKIPHHGPALNERNRGVQHMIYPCPPFNTNPSFEYDDHHHRVPYQDAYATPAELNEAGARDRRAQRALLRANLRILEARKTILEKMKYEMISTMRREIKRVLEERSDLGVGYADYVFPPLV